TLSNNSGRRPSSLRSRACIRPIKALMAGKPQVIGLEMALAFCTRTRGTISRPLELGSSLMLASQLALFALELFDPGLVQPVEVEPQGIAAELPGPVAVFHIADRKLADQAGVEPVGEALADFIYPLHTPPFAGELFILFGAAKIQPQLLGAVEIALRLG